MLQYSCHCQCDKSIRFLDILIVGRVGYEIVLPGDSPSYDMMGDHGFDNRAESMHPIFYAFGPAFRQINRAKPFRNVDLYPLMSHILGLRERKTNGSLDNVKHILIDFSSDGFFSSMWQLITDLFSHGLPGKIIERHKRAFTLTLLLFTWIQSSPLSLAFCSWVWFTLSQRAVIHASCSTWKAPRHPYSIAFWIIRMVPAIIWSQARAKTRKSRPRTTYLDISSCDKWICTSMVVDLILLVFFSIIFILFWFFQFRKQRLAQDLCFSHTNKLIFLIFRVKSSSGQRRYSRECEK